MTIAVLMGIVDMTSKNDANKTYSMNWAWITLGIFIVLYLMAT